MHAGLLAAAALLAIASPLAYGLDIVRGRVRPHRVTRLALMIALIGNLVGTIFASQSPGALMLASVFAVQGVALFALSVPYGMGGAAALDWCCFGVAMAGGVGVVLTSTPELGIIAAIVADAAAYLPTVRKTWAMPETEESAAFYLTSSASAALSLGAGGITLAAPFQLYITFFGFAMTALIYRRTLLRMLGWGPDDHHDPVTQPLDDDAWQPGQHPTSTRPGRAG